LCPKIPVRVYSVSHAGPQTVGHLHDELQRSPSGHADVERLHQSDSRFEHLKDRGPAVLSEGAGRLQCRRIGRGCQMGEIRKKVSGKVHVREPV